MKKIFSSMLILFLFLFANVNAKTVTDLTGKKVTIKDNPSRIAIVPIPWASLAYVVDGDSSKIVGMHPSAKKAYEISMLKELAPNMKNANSVFVDNNFNIKRYLLIGFSIMSISCSTIKTSPEGVNYEGPLRESRNVDFHYDLTYLDKDGNIKYDRNLWEATYKVLDNAKDYLIVEMFLFNDLYNKDKEHFPEFAKEYTERLVKKQKENPNLKVYVLADENNNFYGAFEHPFITSLKEAGIKVIIVDIFKLKDTFPW